MFKKAKEYGDEKVSIAIQTYEMVDKHIRRLDGDLAKFEAEMREKGRLSQTETEEEDDGIDDDNVGEDNGNRKTAAGGRGRKNKGQTPTASSNSKKKKGQKVIHYISFCTFDVVFFQYIFTFVCLNVVNFYNYCLRVLRRKKKRMNLEQRSAKRQIKKELVLTKTVLVSYQMRLTFHGQLFHKKL